VRDIAKDVRDSVILGHQLEVFRADDGHWIVALDGEEIGARFANAYSAWAAGAAESYRQGRASTSSPAVND
jgi:hypothetical protein